MGVIINEFEIVPPTRGEASRSTSSNSEQSNPNAAEPIKADDVKTLLDRCEKRRARVWAH